MLVTVSAIRLDRHEPQAEHTGSGLLVVLLPFKTAVCWRMVPAAVIHCAHTVQAKPEAKPLPEAAGQAEDGAGNCHGNWPVPCGLLPDLF